MVVRFKQGRATGYRLAYKGRTSVGCNCRRRTFNIPGSRGVNYKVGDPEPVPEIVLPTEDHGRMVRLLKGGDEVKMELDVRNTFTDNQKINNIIAEIPGTDPKLKMKSCLSAHILIPGTAGQGC